MACLITFAPLPAVHSWHHPSPHVKHAVSTANPPLRIAAAAQHFEHFLWRLPEGLGPCKLETQIPNLEIALLTHVYQGTIEAMRAHQTHQKLWSPRRDLGTLQQDSLCQCSGRSEAMHRRTVPTWHRDAEFPASVRRPRRAAAVTSSDLILLLKDL